MKRIIFLLLVVASTATVAAPLCWPKEVQGSGSHMIVGFNALYRYASWYCPDTTPDGFYMQVILIGDKKAALKTPGIAGLSVKQALQKYWDANVSNDLKDPKYDATKAEITLRLRTEVVWPEKS